MTISNKTVLIVGATGHLGTMITRELQALEGVHVRALVRPESRQKAETNLGEGVSFVEGDLSSPHALLVEACRGAFSVVSAIQGGPNVLIDGQLALLNAAAEAGVRRMIPSDFSFDMFGLDPGENINTDWRRTFAERANQTQKAVQIAHVFNGCFLDMGVLFGFLGAFDLAKGTIALWGEGQIPMNFTTYADTARYTALAATKAEVPDQVQVAGDTLNVWQLKEAVEAQTGRSFDVVSHGTLADLDAEIAKRQQAEPQNMYAWLPLMYWRAMLNGKGRLQHLVHSQFPEVTLTTVAQYVQQNRAQFQQSTGH